MKKIKLLLLGLAVNLSLMAQDTKLVGGDISMLPQYEKNGVWFFDEDGNRITDVFAYLSNEKVGWNAMRIRLFVNPENASSDDKAGGVLQSLDYVTAIGRRIKAKGLKFLLDFHYSDTWADPAKQAKPAEWKNLSTPEMAMRLYDYTKATLEHLKANDATPDYIQTGNEISYGMLWEEGHVYTNNDTNWDAFTQYLKQATKACREVCPLAKIIIHIERAGQTDVAKAYYERLARYAVDYDIIGLSYYPMWHGDLQMLNTTLTTLTQTFPTKRIQIVETAYNYQWYPTSGVTDYTHIWQATPDGQDKFLKELIALLNTHANVDALYYWFPEENGHANSVISGWLNRGLWNNNNGRALKGLYRLKEFLNNSSTAISSVKDVLPTTTNSPYFTLAGIVRSQTNQKGIYIHQGQKTIFQ